MGIGQKGWRQLWFKCLSAFHVEGRTLHKIDLKTLGMILLVEQEVWDLVEIVEEKSCKMFLDEKILSFSFSFFS